MSRSLTPTIDLYDGTEENRWFPFGVLMAELKKAGCWSDRRHLYRLEDSGHLTLPRVKRPGGWGDRKVKKEHIRQIIAAFSPGGKGEWHYDGQ